MANEKHPCDLCKKTDCCECVLIVYNREYECHNGECFVNHDGSCLLGFYEKCGAFGAWRAEDGA